MPEVLVQIPLAIQEIFYPDIVKAWLDPKQNSEKEKR